MNVYINGELWQQLFDEKQVRGISSLLVAELQCVVLTRNSKGDTQVDLLTSVPEELKKYIGGK